MKITLEVEFKDHDKVVLKNERGDTYTSKSEELMDFMRLMDFLNVVNKNSVDKKVDIIGNVEKSTEPVENDTPLSYFRPKKMGELLEKLKQGVKCEVVASSEEITSIYLDGWLKFGGKYKTFPSENIGWVIYEAI